LRLNCGENVENWILIGGFMGMSMAFNCMVSVFMDAFDETIVLAKGCGRGWVFWVGIKGCIGVRLLADVLEG